MKLNKIVKKKKKKKITFFPPVNSPLPLPHANWLRENVCLHFLLSSTVHC
jgi:hypothetical protein